MSFLSDLPWLLLVWLSKRCRIDGLEVCVAASAAEANAIFIRVRDAFALLGRYDPELKEQVKRDVRRLLFTDTRGGHYFAGIDTCRIGIDFAKRASDLSLAMMIVHEATHARLERSGLRYIGRERERIERLCIDAEVAFAERVPGSQEAIEKARALLATKWWKADQHAEDTMAELIERGVPRWLARRIVERGLKQARTR
jgi:hypothetical protein